MMLYNVLEVMVLQVEAPAATGRQELPMIHQVKDLTGEEVLVLAVAAVRAVRVRQALEEWEFLVLLAAPQLFMLVAEEVIAAVPVVMVVAVRVRVYQELLILVPAPVLMPAVIQEPVVLELSYFLIRQDLLAILRVPPPPPSTPSSPQQTNSTPHQQQHWTL